VDGKVIPLLQETDIVLARKHAKDLAAAIGFELLDQIQVATAVSELARNVIQYAGRGEIRFAIETKGSRRGLTFICHDDGPGIVDLDLALIGGYSTSHGLGRGLSGARNLLDDFRIETFPGKGTTVWAAKWLP
jgi:serine/threonine-protein kinase RsbT